MENKILPEVWLRGPIPGLSPLLQPVAHALLQAREEVSELMAVFPEERLWDRPAGVASVGFHLQHLTGVLDRLFTYARGEALDEEQLRALATEGKWTPVSENAEPGEEKSTPREENGGNSGELTGRFALQVDLALDQLKSIPEDALTGTRGVGRRLLPSTVLGLLVHAAEHVQRHVGQLLVTARILSACPKGPLPGFLQQVGKK